MGFKKTKKELNGIFKEIDKEDAATLDFKEFQSLMQDYLVD
jgi:Ca2+-binding EF-hand superfamily protein